MKTEKEENNSVAKQKDKGGAVDLPFMRWSCYPTQFYSGSDALMLGDFQRPERSWFLYF